MYLNKLRGKSRDDSLSKDKRKALKAEYYSQYAKWKTFQGRLSIAIASLGGSEFWVSMCEALCEHGLCGDGQSLASVEKVVCLCLGSLEENASVHQLALLILLLERLDIHHEKCLVFDPCHSSQENDILNFLGFTILQENDEAKIRVREMTLFYMPHGDYDLTNNLIGANHDSLNLVAILGNNLSWICNSEHGVSPAAEKAKCSTTRAPCVQKVLDIVKETHLQDTLSSKVRAQVARLAPRMSQDFADSMWDSLDCTLSTFPQR
jgi:hypothetical protein